MRDNRFQLIRVQLDRAGQRIESPVHGRHGFGKLKPVFRIFHAVALFALHMICKNLLNIGNGGCGFCKAVRNGVKTLTLDRKSVV